MPRSTIKYVARQVYTTQFSTIYIFLHSEEIEKQDMNCARPLGIHSWRTSCLALPLHHQCAYPHPRSSKCTRMAQNHASTANSAAITSSQSYFEQQRDLLVGEIAQVYTPVSTCPLFPTLWGCWWDTPMRVELMRCNTVPRARSPEY